MKIQRLNFSTIEEDRYVSKFTSKKLGKFIKPFKTSQNQEENVTLTSSYAIYLQSSKLR